MLFILLIDNSRLNIVTFIIHLLSTNWTCSQSQRFKDFAMKGCIIQFWGQWCKPERSSVLGYGGKHTGMFRGRHGHLHPGMEWPRTEKGPSRCVVKHESVFAWQFLLTGVCTEKQVTRNRCCFCRYHSISGVCTECFQAPSWFALGIQCRQHTRMGWSLWSCGPGTDAVYDCFTGITSFDLITTRWGGS